MRGLTFPRSPWGRVVVDRFAYHEHTITPGVWLTVIVEHGCALFRVVAIIDNINRQIGVNHESIPAQYVDAFVERPSGVNGLRGLPRIDFTYRVSFGVNRGHVRE
tara:strand:- start:136 stop:450 length:315 start_codon:yes stop_codon:yes gene_type:complete